MPGLSWSQPPKRMPYQFYNQAVSPLPPGRLTCLQRGLDSGPPATLTHPPEPL